jgi:hypothetical protein
MCFSVTTFMLAYSSLRHHEPEQHSQYIVVQADKAWLTKDQVKVLECLCHPEAFTFIGLLGRLALWYRDIGDSRVSKFSECRIVDSFKHAPRSVLQDRVARDAVQDED